MNKKPNFSIIASLMIAALLGIFSSSVYARYYAPPQIDHRYHFTVDHEPGHGYFVGPAYISCQSDVSYYHSYHGVGPYYYGPYCGGVHGYCAQDPYGSRWVHGYWP